MILFPTFPLKGNYDTPPPTHVRKRCGNPFFLISKKKTKSQLLVPGPCLRSMIEVGQPRSIRQLELYFQRSMRLIVRRRQAAGNDPRCIHGRGVKTQKILNFEKKKIPAFGAVPCSRSVMEVGQPRPTRSLSFLLSKSHEIDCKEAAGNDPRCTPYSLNGTHVACFEYWEQDPYEGLLFCKTGQSSIF